MHNLWEAKKTVVLIALLGLLTFASGCQPSNFVTTNQQTNYQYVGSVNSNKYHYPSCRWAKQIHPDNETWFTDREDAESHGYIPCKVCDP